MSRGSSSRKPKPQPLWPPMQPPSNPPPHRKIPPRGAKWGKSHPREETAWDDQPPPPPPPPPPKEGRRRRRGFCAGGGGDGGEGERSRRGQSSERKSEWRKKRKEERKSGTLRALSLSPFALFFLPFSEGGGAEEEEDVGCCGDFFASLVTSPSPLREREAMTRCLVEHAYVDT